MAKPIQKKEPIRVDILTKFVNQFGSMSCTSSNLRITTLVLISFAGFLRFNEAVHNRRSDQNGPYYLHLNVLLLPNDQTFIFYSFYSLHCCIIVRENKTDVYRQCDQLLIARTGTPLCPVQMLEWYLVTAGSTDATSKEFIFRAVMFCSKQRPKGL